ncbi:MAG: hypothetical protein LRZ85_07475 [Alphaproteobacteria bacterium]|nr:hypothetical protein [Alphaproteobacteria bacterium]MCD8570542.1 hypothetical protein [Alphaproteobacteria bacterium]
MAERNGDITRWMAFWGQTPDYYDNKMGALHITFTKASSAKKAYETIEGANLLGYDSTVYSPSHAPSTIVIYGEETRYRDIIEKLNRIFGASNVTPSGEREPSMRIMYKTYVDYNPPAVE